MGLQCKLHLGYFINSLWIYFSVLGGNANEPEISGYGVLFPRLLLQWSERCLLSEKWLPYLIQILALHNHKFVKLSSIHALN